MATIEIDTENGWDDIEQQIMEMETHELLSIYDMFEQNFTVFSSVANELEHRRRYKVHLEHDGQIEEINRRFR